MSDHETPFYLPLIKKEQLTTDTYSFYFERVGEERDFVPGQYFEMKLDIQNPDERGDSRVFTVASSPTEQEYFMFTTRIIQSSFKLRLNEVNEGEMVQFNGPWDDLNFDEKDLSPRVFLAGGIGITPYHSIVKYAIDKQSFPSNRNLKIPMILFVSWKTRSEMIFDDFFRDANNHLENFSYVPTLTEEEGLSLDEWDGEKGRINADMIKKYVYEIEKNKYYFAGPPAMVSALKQTVIDMGVVKENIIAEEFEGY